MRSLLFAIVLLQAGAAHAAPDCFDGRSQMATFACVGAQAAQARSRLQIYLDAAGARLRRESGPVAAVADAQARWEAFVEADCASVRAWFYPGGIKDQAEVSCKLRHTERRTADVWRTFLTYPDGTPPLLPDPQR